MFLSVFHTLGVQVEFSEILKSEPYEALSINVW